MPGRAAAVFEAAEATEGDVSFAALHGLFWVALNLAAEGPLLLAIDDLHWCDRPSLRFVAYLARRLEGQPILVAATVRSGEPGTDVALLGEIATLPAVAALSGLDETRVADATGMLARAEILRREAPIGFVHALVRDAVYQELPLGERELQHERAARVLLDAGAPPEQVAAHLLAAPRRGQEWVADQLREAGPAARAPGAPG